MKLVFTAINTTGLNPSADELIEIAAVVWDMGKVGPSYIKRFKPTNTVSYESARASGYTPDGWAHAERYTQTDADNLRSVLETAPMICYNPEFVRNFLTNVGQSVKQTFDLTALALPLVFAKSIDRVNMHELNKLFKLESKPGAVEKVHNAIKVFEALITGFCNGPASAIGVPT